MKTNKFTKTIMLAVLSFVLVSARADITTGLVGWWSFDNADGVDRSANSLTGQLQNGPIPVSGRVQGAMRFVGANNYMVVPYNATLNFSSGITISFWLKADYWTPSGTADIILDRRDTGSNKTIYGIHQQDGQLRMLLQAGFGSGDNQTVGVAAPPVNQWIHITATWSGSVLRMYVNGVSAATSSTTTSGSISTLYSRPMLLARTEVFPQNGAAGFKGALDEVRIYNRALSASDVQELYGLAAQSPTISSSGQPKGVAQLLGLPTAFSVTAGGPGPLYYQWWKDGVKLTGKTASSLSILSVAAADAGYYSVVVTNPFGSVTSKSARLAIPGDPTAGVTPTQPDSGSAPLQGSGKDSLVIVTHGWTPDGDIGSWVDTMTNLITAYLINAGSNQWEVAAYKWNSPSVPPFYGSHAWPLPFNVLFNGGVHGRLLGKKLKQQSWAHIHLIGHSAGSALIEAAASELVGSSTTVHTTFLDPYLGPTKSKANNYGASATWSDNYSVKDPLDDADPDSLFGSGTWTEGKLEHCHNIDVTWLDPQGETNERMCESPSAPPNSTSTYLCGYTAKSRHAWPYEYYLQSITNTASPYPQYGFSRSKEAGGWPVSLSYQANNTPIILGDLNAGFAAPQLAINSTSLDLTSLTKATAGNVTVNSSGVSLATASPAWVSIGLTVTNLANAIQFDAHFNSQGQGEGLLSIFWDTNLIGILDERVDDAASQSYTMALPSVELGDAHLLGFRLDPFGTTNSSIVITNVRTAWITTEPPSLSMKKDITTELPMLTIAGYPGAAYLVETSTNLVNWTTVGVFSGTNMPMRYSDSSWATNKSQFFRATPW